MARVHPAAERPACARPLLLAIGWALLVAVPSGAQPLCTNIPRPVNSVPARVVGVVDGDTFVVTRPPGVRERVRLIGVDAPELQATPGADQETGGATRSREAVRALGERARQFAVKWLAARTVFLGFDVQRRDRHGRLLAYVWLLDEISFNVLVIREGYARALTVPPNVRYAGVFVACEREARAAERGLWAR